MIAGAELPSLKLETSPLKLNSSISRLYDLNTGIIGVGGNRHERPHKPLLLLAVLDLIDEGKATPDLIPWCQELRDRFSARFQIVKKHMDRNLIAPCPDHHWHVSKILDHRRSTGEAELLTLAGRTLLLPQDQAFHPDKDGLTWRCGRLIA
jgi:predicted restriction endonuclease